MRRPLFLATVIFCLPAAAAIEGTHLLAETGFAPIVRRSLPAVVNISSSKIVSKTETVPAPFLADPFLRQLFGDEFLHHLQGPHEEREQSLGSGVIISSNGYILTNDHVVDGAQHVKVVLNDNREFEARVIGCDPKTDIAVVKIAAEGLPVLRYGDSSKMEPGNFVLAIGDPFGLRQTVTLGIVSAVGREDVGIEDYEDFIQTDAAINPGDSGGALINSDGQLIGINTAILSGGGGSEGVGFAIPINMARQVMDQIFRNGRVIRAWLGVTTQPVTRGLASAFGLPGEPCGALVAEATPNSPAAKAGLTTGDIIFEMNGQRVADNHDLSLKIAMMAPGARAHLRVLRNRTQSEVQVTLAEQPAPPSKPEKVELVADTHTPASLMDSVDVVELTPGIAEHLRVAPATHGVAVAHLGPASLAAEAGLEPGDVIEQVNRRPVASVSQFNNAVHAAGNQPILLLVNHAGSLGFLLIERD